eukprot:6076126-Pleurochrysis_carterae.AAC.5
MAVATAALFLALAGSGMQLQTPPNAKLSPYLTASHVSAYPTMPIVSRTRAAEMAGSKRPECV